MWALKWRPAGRAADRRLLVPDTSDSMIVFYIPAVSGVCLSPHTPDSSDRQILTGPRMSVPLISRMPPARSHPAVREPSH